MAIVIEEWRFSGTPRQLGSIVSTLAEIRTDIVFRVSPKSDGRVRIDFTRQVDFAEPRDRIVAQGWAIIQPLPSQDSIALLFALNPNKHWLYLSPVWDAVVMESKRQGWTIEKVTSERLARIEEGQDLYSAKNAHDTAVTRPDRDAENNGAATVKTYSVSTGITFLKNWLEHHHNEFFRILYEKNLIKGNLVSLRNGNGLRIFGKDSKGNLIIGGNLNDPLVDLFSLDVPMNTAANYKFEKHLGVIAQEGWAQGKHLAGAILLYGLNNLSDNQTRLEAECVYSEFLPFYDWLLEELKRDYPGTVEVGETRHAHITPPGLLKPAIDTAKWVYTNSSAVTISQETHDLYDSREQALEELERGRRIRQGEDAVSGNTAVTGQDKSAGGYGDTAVSTPDRTGKFFEPSGQEAKSQIDLVKLADALNDHFNESELQDLCFRLNEDYENIPGKTKRDKARELVTYLNRQGRIEELQNLCQQKRPKLAEKFI